MSSFDKRNATQSFISSPSKLFNNIPLDDKGPSKGGRKNNLRYDDDSK